MTKQKKDKNVSIWFGDMEVTGDLGKSNLVQWLKSEAKLQWVEE